MPQLDRLRDGLSGAALADERALRRDLARLRRRAEAGQPVDRGIARVASLLERSRARVELRCSRLPVPEYPPELPVSAAREQVLAALRQHQVVIVAGETGSGKTTQLPKMLLEAGCGRRGMIGHTQPRRLAARTVAQRIAEELKVEFGGPVGFQVRFQDQSSPATAIKVMTDGILLAETAADPELLRYDALVIDEAHERSLNIDFLLGYIKRLLPSRPELRVVVTSATIDVERFAAFFNDAPVISVAGRNFPVEEVYLGGDDGAERDLPEWVEQGLAMVLDLERSGRGHHGGDVLVFLPGERDIRECHNHLRRIWPQRFEFLPLYARLRAADQYRIFSPAAGGPRRVVLATNVAETSVTVPGIRYVIDSGLARVSRYSARSRVQRLPVERISRASADQRKGRCGRLGPGTCIRLYSEADFAARAAYTDPEILRTNLAAVILRMTDMGLGDIARFPFLDPPEPRQVRGGYRDLEELGALDGHRLTALGRSLAALPVDPRLGRALLASAELGCLREVLAVTSALACQDPREWPQDQQQAAQQMHARFAHPGSDLMGWVALWGYLEDRHQALSRNQFSKLCRREFLSWLRVGEWRDLHRQLRLACRQLGLTENQQPADEERVHRALLAGYLSHIGRREEGKEYLGARQRRFLLFPGSVVYRKPPAWVVALELVETTKLYARNNAWIRPDWVLPWAGHLVTRSYSEPHWSPRRGQVMARETVSLFGLVVSDGVVVDYSRIEPDTCREIFIRSALVEGELRSKATFWRHNTGVLQELAELEARSRGGDLLPSDERLYEFYATRIPGEICNQATFERWLRTATRTQPQLLYLDREQLLAAAGRYGDRQQFPSELVAGDLVLPLSYRFEPGHAADGVSVDLPVGVLNRVPLALFDWLVPGLLHEKCCALLKTLPRALRKHFVPVPDCVDRILPELHYSGQSLTMALAEVLQRLYGVRIPADSWQPDKLDPYYRMNGRIIAADGSLLDQGRDLPALVERYRPQLQQVLAGHGEAELPVASQRWDFGRLERVRVLRQGKVDIRTFPALRDTGAAVQLRLCDSAEDAAATTRRGLARLAMLAMVDQARYLRKELLRDNRHQLHFALLRERLPFIEELVQAAFMHTFCDGKAVPETAADFDHLLARHRAELVPNAETLAGWMEQVLASHYRARQLLRALDPRHWGPTIADVEQQLADLLFDGFLLTVPWERLGDYPRYLSAVEMRLSRLGGNQQKDLQATRQLTEFRHRAQQRSGSSWPLPADPALAEYRWLLEEYRVSLFAQSLGTRVPVSARRLAAWWSGAVGTT